ncbi:MAG: HAMP domain-containing sensor histidine kinase [Chloroflexi bacterium]|nr:HAMP domain-containing sensor histidine kinase [Chloroflexota bacterium]
MSVAPKRFANPSSEIDKTQMLLNHAIPKLKPSLSSSINRSAKHEITRTDSLPVDRLVEKLYAERRQRELKDRCLSMISHEFRTPLASIQLSHDLLARYSERATAEERQEYLENIRQQVAHLNEIVSDVVNLTTSNRADLDFNPARHDLLTLCRDIAESFQINRRRHHTIHFRCSESEYFAEFDERLLRRALSNLVGNAVKYSPDGGRVELALVREGDCARISVSDEGIGIPPEDIEGLFSPFCRASNVTDFPGTGLGLAVAKQALDLHGGDISVRSAVGLGTTFEIVLPRRLAPDHSTGLQGPRMGNSVRIEA